MTSLAPGTAMERALARGGMGLDPSYARSPDARARFERVSRDLFVVKLCP